LYTLFSIIIIIICILLLLIILVQNPQGGGLSSTFGSSNQVLGVRKTADFLEKATWTLAILLLSFTLIQSKVINKDNRPQDSVLDESLDYVPPTNPGVPIINNENDE